MRTLLAVLALTLAALAGCTGPDGGDAPEATTSVSTSTSATTSKTATASSSATTTSAAAANQPPAGTVSVVVNQTRATFTLSGSDADGDALSWTLAFGDGNQTNGTRLPATLNATFAPGDYTATYNLTDGKATASSTANFTVAAGSAAPVQQTVTGEWLVGNVDVPGFASAGGCDAVRELDGVFMAMFDVDPATHGAPYVATIAAATTSGSIIAWEVKFLDAACSPEGPYQNGSGPITGTVPTGAVYAWMSADGGADFTGTYVAGN